MRLSLPVLKHVGLADKHLVTDFTLPCTRVRRLTNLSASQSAPITVQEMEKRSGSPCTNTDKVKVPHALFHAMSASFST